MQTLATFRAPWSRTLKAATTTTTVVLLAVSGLGVAGLSRFGVSLGLLTIGGPLLILALGALSAVRGYVLTERALVILRPGWTTTLPLQGLQKVEGRADALKGSIRLFGNGGLWVFAGLFWSRPLGRYRAWATDPSRTVVLHFPDRRVVVTPHDPQQMILRLRTLIATRDYPG